MASTVSAGEQLIKEDAVQAEAVRSRGALWFKLGLRARQIALITLFVAFVVMIITVANIAHLTGVIISRTEEQARQLSNQISYAVQQEVAHNIAIDDPNPYATLASENSGVRGLMESTIVTSRQITYVYL